MGKNDLFDWRDYITIDDRYGKYFDADGKPTPYLQNEKPDIQKIIEPRVTADHQNAGLIAKTLDQISLIPEVQKLIQDAHHVLQDQLKQDPEYAKEIGGKLRISIGDMHRTGYNSGQLNINSREIERFKYQFQAFHYGDMSLQQVIIHELHHGADPSLTEGKDLAQRKDATRAAIGSALQLYPELKQEYKDKKTLFGKNFDALLGAKSMEEFGKLYNHLVDDHTGLPLSFVQKQLNAEDPLHRILDFPLVFDSAFNTALQGITTKQDEMPVIKKTNEIMAKYYGEPGRISYEGQNIKPPGEKYGDPAPSLAPFTHPDILPKGLARTKGCPRSTLPSGCPDAHIEGASYSAHPHEAAPAAEAPPKPKPPAGPAN